jgi:hypothetical protein
VCGLENGTIWILHHITLEVLDEIPYKHSHEAINKIAFARCGEYMAYVVRSSAFHNVLRIADTIMTLRSNEMPSILFSEM